MPSWSTNRTRPPSRTSRPSATPMRGNRNRWNHARRADQDPGVNAKSSRRHVIRRDRGVDEIYWYGNAKGKPNLDAMAQGECAALLDCFFSTNRHESVPEDSLCVQLEFSLTVDSEGSKATVFAT
mmetsp:Transcript_267/g.741  ORF Transcript_267/g.741 Transcript_267/m.741 type:complete len:125 (-) Transcript_267:175-549(-)